MKERKRELKDFPLVGRLVVGTTIDFVYPLHTLSLSATYTKKYGLGHDKTVVRAGKIFSFW